MDLSKRLMSFPFFATLILLSSCSLPRAVLAISLAKEGCISFFMQIYENLSAISLTKEGHISFFMQKYENLWVISPTKGHIFLMQRYEKKNDHQDYVRVISLWVTSWQKEGYSSYFMQKYEKIRSLLMYVLFIYWNYHCRIEDVLHRYVSLPDHDRGGYANLLSSYFRWFSLVSG